MSVLFFNLALLLCGLFASWIYFILCLKTKDNFGLAMSVFIFSLATFTFGGIVKKYWVLDKLVKEEVVERVYDSQTGEAHYSIKNGVIGFDQSFKKLEESVDKENE